MASDTLSNGSCSPRTAIPRVESRSCVKDALATQKSIIVIKVGTSSLVRPEQNTLNMGAMTRICETVKLLRMQGHHVVLVSSGASGVGCQRLGLAKKPCKQGQRQALPAVGQSHLIRHYEDIFQALDLTCAQVLLTSENLAERNQYINARNTFTELLAYGVIPVVNENDTVASTNFRFGDNDSLAALVAALIQADYLFLLTDVDGLYTANPKNDPSATRIAEVEDISQLMVDTSTSGTEWGTGGMATKLSAGRIATAAGCTMIICDANEAELVPEMIDGQLIGTRFHPLKKLVKGRKRWVLTLPVRGHLWLDAGAANAVRNRHGSVLACGVMRVVGDWSSQDAVAICDEIGTELARGICDVDSQELTDLLEQLNTAPRGAKSKLQPVINNSKMVLLCNSTPDVHKCKSAPDLSNVMKMADRTGKLDRSETLSNHSEKSTHDSVKSLDAHSPRRKVGELSRKLLKSESDKVQNKGSSDVKAGHNHVTFKDDWISPMLKHLEGTNLMEDDLSWTRAALSSGVRGKQALAESLWRATPRVAPEFVCGSV